MIDEIRASLSRHLPGYEVGSFSRLGAGLDNVVYEVNSQLIVRGSKETNATCRSESTRREANLLTVVGRWSTLPVPEPIFADIEAGVLAYPKLPGFRLLDHPVAEPARLAPTLGQFVSRLHSAPVEIMEQLVPRDTDPLMTWRRAAARSYLDVVEYIPSTSRGPVEDFLGMTPPAEPRVLTFCHNDLGTEHVLVDVEANTVTGIIDWTDAAIADPVRDVALIYRDLGPEIFEVTVGHYEGHLDDADRERAVFYARCALLEDIDYGLSNGARAYAEAGLAHLARIFE